MDVTRDQANVLLERIAASSGFVRSERLIRFLRFAVEETLEGRGERLKEYTIALEVYGKSPSYDPQVDSLVRVQASQLRTRLDRYYAAEGRDDPIRLEIPKGGYQVRFVRAGEPAAEPEAPAPLPPAPRHRFRIAAIAASVIAGAAVIWMLTSRRTGTARVAQTMAVLPFTDVSPNHDQASLGDGIANELIQALGRNPGLRPVAQGSAFQYRDVADLHRIAAELHVRSVVTGTVRRDGDRLHVTSALTRTDDGSRIWTASYDRKADDLYGLESEIVQAIAAGLRAEPRDGSPRAAAPSPEAYRHYMTGRFWRIEPTLTNLYRAHTEFTAAVAADPAYAEAHAALAELYGRIYMTEIVAPEPNAITMEEALKLARKSAARALQLNDLLSEAHEAQALVDAESWKLTEAEREYRRALELDPANGRARYAYAQLCLTPLLRFDEAAQQLRSALEVDPVSQNLITELGATYRLGGQLARAREQFWKSLDLNPRAYGTRTNLAVTDLVEGKYEEAVARIEKVHQDTPDDAWVMGHLGYAYAKAGRIADARKIVDTLKSNSTAAMHIAAVYAGLGDAPHALDAVERGVAAKSPSLLWLRSDFRFAPLHDDPRYRALEPSLPH